MNVYYSETLSKQWYTFIYLLSFVYLFTFLPLFICLFIHVFVVYTFS